jgi:hypothetical protein
LLFLFSRLPQRAFFKRKNGKKESNLTVGQKRKAKKNQVAMGGPFRGETVHPEFFWRLSAGALAH